MANRSVMAAESMSVRLQQSSGFTTGQRIAEMHRQVGAKLDKFSRKLINRSFKKYIALYNVRKYYLSKPQIFSFCFTNHLTTNMM